MITCTRRLQFAAGHRVLGHENKCANVHGHNYVVEITAEAQLGTLPLDGIGRVIDFSVLKERVGGWIDAQWDHGFILYEEDQQLFVALNPIRAFDAGREYWRVTKLHLMPTNPTAENMAEYLLRVVCPMVLHDTGVRVVRVVVHETENCKAEATL